jgi:hypothetical protein
LTADYHQQTHGPFQHPQPLCRELQGIHSECKMAFPLPFVPASEAASELGRSSVTLRTWLHRYPDLGMVFAGRLYIWPAVVAAIATGSTLEDAAKIGAREKAAYLTAQRARFAQWFTAPADATQAAAAA